jgi:hypothetical protein
MSLLIPNDTLGLDYIYRGQPFVIIPTSITLDTRTLDYVFRAQPLATNPIPLRVTIYDECGANEQSDIQLLITINYFEEVISNDELFIPGLAVLIGISDVLEVVEDYNLIENPLQFFIFEDTSCLEELTLCGLSIYISIDDLLGLQEYNDICENPLNIWTLDIIRVLEYENANKLWRFMPRAKIKYMVPIER